VPNALRSGSIRLLSCLEDEVDWLSAPDVKPCAVSSVSSVPPPSPGTDPIGDPVVTPAWIPDAPSIAFLQFAIGELRSYNRACGGITPGHAEGALPHRRQLQQARFASSRTAAEDLTFSSADFIRTLR